MALLSRLSESLWPLSAEHVPPEGPLYSDYDLNPHLAPMDPAAELHAAAVLVGVCADPVGEAPTVILTRRAEGLRRHQGQIALPGGRLDPGETPVIAALREAHEEIGLEPDHVDTLGLGAPYRTGSGFLITPVVGRVRACPPQWRTDPGEVAEVFSVPFDFLMDLNNYRQQSYVTPEGVTRHFYAVPWQDRFIWGVTAGVLRALALRLSGHGPA